MQISEIMSRHPLTVTTGHSLREAAEIMDRAGCGFLPVGEDDRLVGMLTDRDIALRGCGAGHGPDASVREAMTEDLCYCFEDDETEAVSRSMGEQQIRRMPVIDRNKRLVGIVSLGDIAVRGRSERIGETLEQISQPGGAHS